jgi:hypothetical protein
MRCCCRHYYILTLLCCACPMQMGKVVKLQLFAAAALLLLAVVGNNSTGLQPVHAGLHERAWAPCAGASTLWPACQAGVHVLLQQQVPELCPARWPTSSPTVDNFRNWWQLSLDNYRYR